MNLLNINNLSIRHGQQVLVDDLSLTINAGEWLALVGESGSGKSLTALACLGLLSPSLNSQGELSVTGINLAQATPDELRSLRGSRVGMVYQEPLSALNPLHRIGQQLIEAITLHQALPLNLARQKALSLLQYLLSTNRKALLKSLLDPREILT